MPNFLIISLQKSAHKILSTLKSWGLGCNGFVNIINELPSAVLYLNSEIIVEDSNDTWTNVWIECGFGMWDKNSIYEAIDNGAKLIILDGYFTKPINIIDYLEIAYLARINKTVIIGPGEVCIKKAFECHSKNEVDISTKKMLSNYYQFKRVTELQVIFRRKVAIITADSLIIDEISSMLQTANCDVIFAISVGYFDLRFSSPLDCIEIIQSDIVDFCVIIDTIDSVVSMLKLYSECKNYKTIPLFFVAIGVQGLLDSSLKKVGIKNTDNIYICELRDLKKFVIEVTNA